MWVFGYGWELGLKLIYQANGNEPRQTDGWLAPEMVHRQPRVINVGGGRKDSRGVVNAEQSLAPGCRAGGALSAVALLQCRCQ